MEATEVEETYELRAKAVERCEGRMTRVSYKSTRKLATVLDE